MWLNKKEKQTTVAKNDSIVFVNKPVTEPSCDVIGFDAQVNTIQKAIDNGATMIGVIADYGTGKSSMTELLCSVVTEKGHPHPIKINMWDCLSDEDLNSTKGISNLTKSFLFQLSNGKESSFGRYINKVLSKNYGNISFSTSNPNRFFISAILSGVFWALYLITSIRNTGILNVLPQWASTIAPFIKMLSPGFMVAAVACLLFGLIDLSIAFSHWKMPNKREIEINDVFDTYRTIIEHITPPKGKKQLIFIDDLDRISDKATVITFLKEIYRFQESIKADESATIVFIVSLKPESELQPQTTGGSTPNDSKSPVANSEHVYSKVFDTTLFLKPIHFDDYDSILLRLIKNEPEKKQALELLIKEKIENTLPISFKWIKHGTNLTLRDLKDRLNHAIAIMVSLESKSYKGNSAASFISCSAVAYLESQFPSDYYRLIKHEETFAEFMRQSYKIVNDAKSTEGISKLLEKFKTDFKSQEFSTPFIEAFCSMILDGTFNDDFRMYFYTYPKDSHIKTTEERFLCNCLLYPNQNPAPLNLDEFVTPAYEKGPNECIGDTLKTLTTYPSVVLKSDALFKHAVSISLPKVFSTFANDVISVFDFENDLSIYWKRIKALEPHARQVFIQKCIEKVLSFTKDDAIIRTRLEIIKGYGDDILEFKDAYAAVSDIPQITAEEIRAIGNPILAVQLVNVEKIATDQYQYLFDLTCSTPLLHLPDTGKQAMSIVTKLTKLLSPADIGDRVLKFLHINQTLDDGLFKIVCAAGLSNDCIAEYINAYDPAMFSQKYLELIDNLGFEEHIKEDVVLSLAKNNLFYTAILYFSKQNHLQLLDPFLENVTPIYLSTQKINTVRPNVIITFRKHCLFSADAHKLDVLYYGNYPLITVDEFQYFQDAKTAIEHINTTAIEEENISELTSIIYARQYTPDDLFYLFEYLFDEAVNKDCINDEDIITELINAMDFQQFNVCNLTLAQRSRIYASFSNQYAIQDAADAESFIEHFGCLIPEVEAIICKDSTAEKNYCNLIAKIDEFTEVTLEWIKSHYLIAPVSRKLCDILYDKGFYADYIIGNTLRDQQLRIDERIAFDSYIEVYKEIDDVFDIMSNHWDFLELLQSHANFSTLSEDLLIPMFKVRQSTRFFTYVLSDKTTSAFKRTYLKEFGKFREEADSIAFQKLICKPENIKLVDSLELKTRISQQLWETHRAHKAVFTRKWKEEWGSKLLQEQPV